MCNLSKAMYNLSKATSMYNIRAVYNLRWAMYYPNRSMYNISRTMYSLSTLERQCIITLTVPIFCTHVDNKCLFSDVRVQNI